MHYVHRIKDTTTSTVWTFSSTSNTRRPMVLFIHRFYHRSSKFQFNGLYSNGFRMFDEDDTFHCNKTITSEEIVKIFFQNIYRIHKLPNNSIAHHDTQFIFNFKRGLVKILEAKINLFLGYYPQSNGQIERVN